MVVRNDQPIAMPRPFGGDAPTITVNPRFDGKPGSYITVQITGVIHSIYQYLEFIQILDSASENDLIDVVIDTPGGCVFTTQVLLERMNSSKAKVTAVASGLVASAGTFLWFFSKHREVDEWATFMFHSSSHGDYGKSLAIQETSTEMVKYMQKTVKAMIAAGILTAEEATKIFKQKKDLFLPGSIIRARMLQAVAATEGIALRAEESGEYPDPSSGEDAEKDRPTDPEGQPDQHANDDVDGEKTSIDPAAIFRAEGVEPGEGGDDDGGDDDAGDDDGGDDSNPEDKCGKGKKKAKKRRARGEGENDDDGVGDDNEPGDGSDDVDTPSAKKGKGKKAKKRRAKGEGDDGDDEGDGSEDNPVDPEQATSPEAYLKW